MGEWSLELEGKMLREIDKKLGELKAKLFWVIDMRLMCMKARMMDRLEAIMEEKIAKVEARMEARNFDCRGNRWVVKSLVRELEIYLQADEVFISECKRLKQVLNTPTPTGAPQTQSLADIPPKLSTMITWRVVAVPGRGGLGPKMFSLLRERFWKVTLQAVVFVWWQPVTDGTVAVEGCDGQ